jgi:hypothetical protein
MFQRNVLSSSLHSNHPGKVPVGKGEWVAERHHTNWSGDARHWVGPGSLAVTRTSASMWGLTSLITQHQKYLTQNYSSFNTCTSYKYVHHITIHILWSMSIVPQTTHHEWCDSTNFWKHCMCIKLYWPTLLHHPRYTRSHIIAPMNFGVQWHHL